MNAILSKYSSVAFLLLSYITSVDSLDTKLIADASSCPSFLSNTDEVFNILGNWVKNESTLNVIRNGIVSSQLVVIHNAFADNVARKLRAELITALPQFENPDPTNSIGDYYKNSIFTDSSKQDICEEVNNLNNGNFFFYHMKPKSYKEVTPYSQHLFDILGSKEAFGIIDYLLGNNVSTIHNGLFGVRSLPEGAMYGMHDDNIFFKTNGLSMTSYFTDPSIRWKSEYGGHFVWCADSMTALTKKKVKTQKLSKKPSADYIPPDYNSMILFRVNDYSEHFVEPLRQGAPDRLVFQGWWYRAVDPNYLTVPPRAVSRKQRRKDLILRRGVITVNI